MSGMTVAELVSAVEQQLPSSVIDYNGNAHIALSDGRVTVALESAPIGDQPPVKLIDRLAQILGLATNPDYELIQLHYSYSSGYEDAQYGHQGRIRFSGSYHPNGMCEGRGACTWCGCTLID